MGDSLQGVGGYSDVFLVTIACPSAQGLNKPSRVAGRSRGGGSTDSERVGRHIVCLFCFVYMNTILMN